jgi:hypothetical protein
MDAIAMENVKGSKIVDHYTTLHGAINVDGAVQG